MGSINSRNGLLFLDFRFMGVRCREYTKLADSVANRKRLSKANESIEAEIAAGTFVYSDHFPGSKMAAKLGAQQVPSQPAPVAASSVATVGNFKVYCEEWFKVTKISWRSSHTATVRSTLDCHLIPHFGEKDLGSITKADVLQFRAGLAEIAGRSGNKSLSPKTINRIIQILGQVMEEAGERFDITNPVNKVKRLRQPRLDIQPFSLDQVRLLIDTIRPDYRDYLTVRFFTGMRTGELHGLKHQYLDFDRRQILIRQTIVRGELTYTKTDGSQREIDMSQPVYEALQRQAALTRDKSDFVFCTRTGEPLDLNDVTNRVWYPMLRLLNLQKRRPYQTRHTAATLWLAAGENPEWVARQLGHNSTEMLFKTYSRYVPNLTRRDGSAFNNMLTSALNGGVCDVNAEIKAGERSHA